MIGGHTLIRLSSSLLAGARSGRARTRSLLGRAIGPAATHDPLTGLLTHAGLVDAGRSLPWLAEVNASVVMLDLDHFRHINTAFSRLAGDLVLETVARRIEASAPAGALVARFGGDEFVIVLPSGGEAFGRELADRLIREIARPIEVEGQPIVVSISVGVAGLRRGEPLESALRRAGAAISHAKDQEPGQRVRPFRPEMTTAVRRRFTLEGELRQAIAMGQFRLHYQPLVDLETHVTSEVEALIRWEHPRRGLLLPSEFLPGADAAGLMREIGRWVLGEACRQGQRWHEELGGQRVMMAVNLSPSQFRDPRLLDDIALILDETGFDPTLLKLEISESVTPEDIEPACALMERARPLGIRMALDDFGAGYAGWTFIQRCPVDTIKLDRSLLEEAPDAPVNRSQMIEAILAFARHLGMPVSIEGVERADQACAMRRLGVTTAQGFYFSEARPPHLIAPMLAGAPLQPVA